MLDERQITINTDDKVVRIYGRVKYGEIVGLIANADEEHADEYYVESMPKLIHYKGGKQVSVT